MNATTFRPLRIGSRGTGEFPLSNDQKVDRPAGGEFGFEVELRRFVDVGEQLVECCPLRMYTVVNARGTPRPILILKDLNLHEHRLTPLSIAIIVGSAG